MLNIILRGILMILNKHGSFYIRSGWPTKILLSLKNDKYIFSPNKELNAVDEIGVGRVMIKAMRYWAIVLGLAEESHDNQGVKCELTDLAELITDKDLYCQDKGTLWLLHRNLACNEERATVWYWAFNEFRKNSFDKQTFSNDFFIFATTNGNNFSLKTIEKEFDCFKNTYVSDKTFNVNEIINENTIPFFAPLNLLTYEDGKFYKHNPTSKDIPLEILLYCIIEDNKLLLNESKQIDLDLLLNGKTQIGSYLNLSYTVLLDLLQRLDNIGYINLINNFGNRYIEIFEKDSKKILETYFSKPEA